ncbi:MAG: hypothetical protein ABIC95_07175 [archaeon]
MRRFMMMAVLLVALGLLLTACGKQKEPVDLPPFPDADPSGGPMVDVDPIVIPDIEIEEPDLMADDEVDIGELI